MSVSGCSTVRSYIVDSVKIVVIGNKMYFASLFLFLKDYVRSDPSGRTLDDTMIIQVKQGYEPLNFTGHFQAWDREKWSVSLFIYNCLALLFQRSS